MLKRTVKNTYILYSSQQTKILCHWACYFSESRPDRSLNTTLSTGFSWHLGILDEGFAQCPPPQRGNHGTCGKLRASRLLPVYAHTYSTWSHIVPLLLLEAQSSRILELEEANENNPVGPRSVRRQRVSGSMTYWTTSASHFSGRMHAPLRNVRSTRRQFLLPHWPIPVPSTHARKRQQLCQMGWGAGSARKCTAMEGHQRAGATCNDAANYRLPRRFKIHNHNVLENISLHDTYLWWVDLTLLFTCWLSISIPFFS